MLPASPQPASAASSHSRVHTFSVSQLSRYHNTPEEDDETMSTEEREAGGVHEPDAHEPDSHRPDSHQPDSHEPDSHRPDAHEPDSHRPDAHRPDAHRADAHEPDAHRPDSHRPDAHRPDSHRPDAHRPDFHRPDAHRADAHRPDAHRADAHRPDSHRSDSHRSDSHRPDSHRPDSHRPDSHRPDAHRADAHRPDAHRPDSHRLDSHRPAPERRWAADSSFGGSRPDSAGFCCYQPPGRLPAGYSQPTPFPSRADDGAWLHPSFASSWSGYPGSLPSSLSQKDWSCRSGDGSLSGYKFVSLPGRSSPSMSSLEQPFSLCSNPPSGNLCHHTLPPYSCSPQGAACCAQCPADGFNGGPAGAWPPYHPAYDPYDPGACRRPGAGYSQLGRFAPAKEKQPPHSAPLSLEQRRVFVTYESDDDKHVNEVINFVALLRHNGFDTHIDIFEQQFRSISKIDFMERYLSEKEYLIIIIISPKYYETVTASPVGLENDERTFNTVYIHKQLQNEFIQNGSKNFRFIPIVFPRAKKCHVPNWLQNTHVYEWPLHRDDILRRLMRVEKYNPPPIGALPTIVSIPI